MHETVTILFYCTQFQVRDTKEQTLSKKRKPAAKKRQKNEWESVFAIAFQMITYSFCLFSIWNGKISTWRVIYAMWLLYSAANMYRRNRIEFVASRQYRSFNTIAGCLFSSPSYCRASVFLFLSLIHFRHFIILILSFCRPVSLSWRTLCAFLYVVSWFREEIVCINHELL